MPPEAPPGTSPISDGGGAVRHSLTRRRLLKLGFGLGGAAVVVGSGAAYVLWPRAPAPGRKLLSEGEARLVAALADAYLPPGNAFGVAGSDVEIAAGVDQYLAALPPTQARLLRGLLITVDLWPRISLRSRSRFVALSREERTSVLAAFETSTSRERRQLASLLRLLVAIPFFDDERVRASPDMQWGCPVIP